jgi:hypothetical protein
VTRQDGRSAEQRASPRAPIRSSPSERQGDPERTSGTERRPNSRRTLLELRDRSAGWMPALGGSQRVMLNSQESLIVIGPSGPRIGVLSACNTITLVTRR